MVGCIIRHIMAFENQGGGKPYGEDRCMTRIIVDKYYCKGCGLCVDVCTENIMVLNMEEISQKGYHPAICIDDGACSACMNCVTMCPDVAITIER
jgi:2-oxoglutarate ferredoxin oxidoreductase subunit delta